MSDGSDHVRLSKTMRQMVDGDGYVKIKIPFTEDINSPEELAAVVKVLIDKAKKTKIPPSSFYPPEAFKPIFEHAILDEFGFAKESPAFSEDIGQEPNRFQAKIVRPLQAASTKTLIDNSPESRIFQFCESIVENVMNKDSDVQYMLSELNILMSAPHGREQSRHFDFEDYSEPELIAKPNCSFILPIEHRGLFCAWPKSHHAVHAEHKVRSKLIPSSKAYSAVEEILTEKGINMQQFEKQELLFGIDEMIGFLDNTVHSGACNYASVPVYRIHFYVVRKDCVSATEYTNMPYNIVWDITRKGAKSVDVYTDHIKATDDKETDGTKEDERSTKKLKKSLSSSSNGGKRGRPKKTELQ
jgi:hypothetical protein